MVTLTLNLDGSVVEIVLVMVTYEHVCRGVDVLGIDK